MTNAIKRIELTNFQSHERTEIQPAPPGGLTVIVGPSGHGKTAILRALRWLLYNQPQGLSFMRKGAQTVQVTAELTSGVVTRRRTAGTNQYITVTDEKGRQVFEGFGTDVPLEIQQLTGVKPVRIADLTLQPNLARQLDGPFLGEESTSAGTRAKVLGRIAGIDEVDLATKSLATDQFRRGQEEKRLEREIADLTAREASYAHLPALRQRIEQLEALSAKLTQMDARRTALMKLSLQQHFIAAGKELAQLTVDRWAQVLPGLEAAIDRVEAAVAREAHLNSLTTRFCDVELRKHAAYATRTRWAGADEALDWTIDCFAWYERRKRIDAQMSSLREVRASITAATATLTRTAGAEAALTILEATAKAADQWVTMRRLRTALSGIGWDKQVVTSVLNRLANAGRAAELLSMLQAEVHYQDRVKKMMSTLWQTQNLAGETRQRALRLQKAVADDEQVYIDTLTAAGRCPVCGSEIHPEHIKEAV